MQTRDWFKYFAHHPKLDRDSLGECSYLENEWSRRLPVNTASSLRRLNTGSASLKSSCIFRAAGRATGRAPGRALQFATIKAATNSRKINFIV